MNPYANAYKEKSGFPFGLLAGFLLVLAMGLVGLGVYFLVQTAPIKTQVLADVAAAAEEAKTAQLAVDQKGFDAAVAKTTKTFVSSEDSGAITFEYPKGWTSYIDQDGTGKDPGAYSAYFNPGLVPPVDSGEVYSHALILSVKPGSLADIQKGLEGNLKKGLVAESEYRLQNESMNVVGKKYEGLVASKNKEKNGTMIVFAFRDKTLALYSFVPEQSAAFYDPVLKTIRWTE